MYSGQSCADSPKPPKSQVSGPIAAPKMGSGPQIYGVFLGSGPQTGAAGHGPPVTLREVPAGALQRAAVPRFSVQDARSRRVKPRAYPRFGGFPSAPTCAHARETVHEHVFSLVRW